MSQPASRLITLILLLQRQPNQKAAALAEKLGVSVRTLHRYFATLDEMGIPVYTERGPQGGFSLVRGYKMPPLVLSPEEATAVYLGAGMVEEMWGSLYREAAQGALAKLEFEPFAEGLCVQLRHVGPYEGMDAALDRMIMAAGKLGYAVPSHSAHDIYLNDVRKTKPENLQAVMRLPVIETQ